MALVDIVIPFSQDFWLKIRISSGPMIGCIADRYFSEIETGPVESVTEMNEWSIIKVSYIAVAKDYPQYKLNKTIIIARRNDLITVILRYVNVGEKVTLVQYPSHIHEGNNGIRITVVPPGYIEDPSWEQSHINEFEDLLKETKLYINDTYYGYLWDLPLWETLPIGEITFTRGDSQANIMPVNDLSTTRQVQLVTNGYVVGGDKIANAFLDFQHEEITLDKGDEARYIYIITLNRDISSTDKSLAEQITRQLLDLEDNNIIAASITYEKTLFYDNFENDPIGSLPYNWIVAWSGEKYGVTDKNAAHGEKSLYLKGAYGWSCVLYRVFYSNASVIGFEANVWLGEPRTYKCPNNYGCSELPIAFFCKECVRTWGDAWTNIRFNFSSHEIFVKWGSLPSETKVIGKFAPRHWFHIKVILNRETATYDVWINGTLLAKNIPVVDYLADKTYLINSVSVGSGWGGPDVYIDDVRVFEVVNSTSTTPTPVTTTITNTVTKTITTTTTTTKPVIVVLTKTDTMTLTSTLKTTITTTLTKTVTTTSYCTKTTTSILPPTTSTKTTIITKTVPKTITITETHTTEKVLQQIINHTETETTTVTVTKTEKTTATKTSTITLTSTTSTSVEKTVTVVTGINDEFLKIAVITIIAITAVMTIITFIAFRR